MSEQDAVDPVKRRRRRIEDKLRKNFEESDLKVVEHMVDHIINLKESIAENISTAK